MLGHCLHTTDNLYLTVHGHLRKWHPSFAAGMASTQPCHPVLCPAMGSKSRQCSCKTPSVRHLPNWAAKPWWPSLSADHTIQRLYLVNQEKEVAYTVASACYARVSPAAACCIGYSDGHADPHQVWRFGSKPLTDVAAFELLLPALYPQYWLAAAGRWRLPCFLAAVVDLLAWLPLLTGLHAVCSISCKVPTVMLVAEACPGTSHVPPGSKEMVGVVRRSGADIKWSSMRMHMHTSASESRLESRSKSSSSSCRLVCVIHWHNQVTGNAIMLTIPGLSAQNT